MKTALFAVGLGYAAFTASAPADTPSSPPPAYTIEAIRYATVPQFPASALVMGAPRDEKIDIAMVVWLVRGGGRAILFDTGFHREKWFKAFPMTDYTRPDEAVRGAGVAPEEVTDLGDDSLQPGSGGGALERRNGAGIDVGGGDARAFGKT